MTTIAFIKDSLFEGHITFSKLAENKPLLWKKEILLLITDAILCVNPHPKKKTNKKNSPTLVLCTVNKNKHTSRCENVTDD